MFTDKCKEIFTQSIKDYHVKDDVDTPMNNPYEKGSIEYLLYLKNWIDTVQWHLEDIIRDPQIEAEKALEIKRRIDSSNQERTDVVEMIDDYFLDKYKDVQPLPTAKINTESPAWAIDRLSILALKIYHMQEQVNRTDAEPEHLAKCQAKLQVLSEQNVDLPQSIEELLEEYSQGEKVMKVYRQMKMYNDPSMNPILYKQNKR
jgi:hypothetical protein